MPFSFLPVARIAALLVLPLPAAFAQTAKTDLQRDGYAGSVKEVKVLWYRAENGVAGKSEPVHIYTYDRQGRKTSHMYAYMNAMGFTKNCTWTYDSRGDLTEERCEGQHTKMEYDAFHREIKKERFTQDGQLKETALKKYDGDGHLLEVSSTYAGKTEPSYIKQYTYQNGNLTEVLEHYGNPEKFTRYRYTYNAAGKVTSDKRTSEKGFLSHISYSYDSANNLTEEKTLNENGSAASSIRYTYDKSGNLILRKQLDEQGRVIEGLIYTATYNSQSQLIKLTESDMDGNHTSYSSAYGKDGRLFKQTHYTYEGKIKQEIFYTYDAQGNCIAEKIHTNGKEEGGYLYEISYY